MTKSIPAQEQHFLPPAFLSGAKPILPSTSEFTVYQIGDLIYGVVSRSIPNDLSQGVEDVYNEVLELLKSEKKTNLWRCWHLIPEINKHENGDERYKRFCTGRYRSLISSGFVRTENLPAASAVGTNLDNYTMAFLASARKGKSINNPNQVDAYNYPPKYGEHSPSFSRAYLSGETLFVSGTASISGHKSLHRGDLNKQLLETKQRLDELTRSYRPKHLTAYVRKTKDMDEVSCFINTHYPKLATCQILNADICRKELLIEIEIIAQ